ncbi:MAG: winged helix-turn-helix domain-containing protein, partial [Bacteroidota bacterium]
RWPKLSAMQITRLRQRLNSHDVVTQQQILVWIREEMGIEYTQGGISMLLTRLKIKLKTGRPSNVRKDQAGAESFKKTSAK